MGRISPKLALLPLLSLSCARLLGYDGLEPGDSQDASVVDSASGDADAATDDSKTATPVHPPPRPKGARTPSGRGKTLWLIAKRLYLTTQTLGGVKDKTAWRDFGYDLDGKCTGPTQAAAATTCKPAAGAGPEVLIDGNDCRDNNFGSRLVPLMTATSETFEDETNKAISDGDNTWLLRLDDLDDGADDPYVPGALYVSADGAGYKFDGTDVPRVERDSVVANDLGKPRVTFASGYMVGHLWVSGDGESTEVYLPLSDLAFRAPVVGAVFTARLSDDHTLASTGQLVGVIGIGELGKRFGAAAARATGPALCPGSPTYDVMLAALGKMPDLVLSAPNFQDPTVTCDALSLGVGYALSPVMAPTAVVADPPLVDPCIDAGVDGGPDAPDTAPDAPTDGLPDTSPDSAGDAGDVGDSSEAG